MSENSVKMENKYKYFEKIQQNIHKLDSKKIKHYMKIFQQLKHITPHQRLFFKKYSSPDTVITEKTKKLFYKLVEIMPSQIQTNIDLNSHINLNPIQPESFNQTILNKNGITVEPIVKKEKNKYKWELRLDNNNYVIDHNDYDTVSLAQTKADDFMKKINKNNIKSRISLIISVKLKNSLKKEEEQIIEFGNNRFIIFYVPLNNINNLNQLIQNQTDYYNTKIQKYKSYSIIPHWSFRGVENNVFFIGYILD